MRLITPTPAAALILAAAAAAAISSSCGGKSGSTGDVPLPYAYPRTALADTVYRPVGMGGLNFDVNAGATVADAPTAGGIDIRYPAYRGNFYLSINSEADPGRLAEAIANRRHRFALNLTGAPARSESFVNDAGFNCELVTTAEAIPTPVMFLAHDGKHTLLSGAFAFGSLDPAATADSIAPTVGALRADALRLLRSLRAQ